MRILSIVRRGYYGSGTATEPMYLYFTKPLQQMGHQVQTFDHYESAAHLGVDQATDMLAATIQAEDFDVCFYQTAGHEPVNTAALRDLSKRFCIAAWNSDDDWQWESSTSKTAADFTFMITTYPHIYEANRSDFPNLLLSQWGCYPPFSEFSKVKDLGFSFAGSIYGARNPACRFLQSRARLHCFGRGSRLVKLGLPYFKGAFRLNALSGPALDFEQVHEIWNRSRISYTPMGGGPDSQILSIKGRAFEMGLSGTMMLSELSPNLDRYYDPGREFIAFDTLEDCADKAKFYLAHGAERLRIATKYRDRTVAEHLWEHRFSKLFAEMGIKATTPMKATRSVQASIMTSGTESYLPAVSIAMPFYNSAQTLRASIESIRNQTYKNWELLMPDDGSTDGSLEIARSFGDPRIIVWSDGQRKNLAARLNECIDRARGALLARMDGDDLAYPERIDKQVQFLNSNPEIDLLGTGMLVFGRNGEPLGKRLGPTSHAGIARRPTLSFRLFHPTFMGRVEWFRRYRYSVKAKLGQDQELLFRAHRDSCYANLRDILLGYREDEIDLKKILRSRRLWLKHLSWHLRGPGDYLRLGGTGIVFGLRGFLDYVAVATGLRYRLLRQRAQPITESERQTWLEVWSQTGGQVLHMRTPSNSMRAPSSR